MNILKTLREKKAEQRKKNKAEKSKMIVFRKKQIVATSLVVLIAVCGYLNWSINEEMVDESVSVMYNEASKKLGEAQMVGGAQMPEGENSEENATEAGGYFAKARLDREIKRDEAIEMLKGVLESPDTTVDAKQKAESEIFTIAQFMQNEAGAENLIRARGFTECLVYMTEEGANVAVETSGLCEEEVALITDSLVSAGCDTDCDIKIVEIMPGS